MSSVPKNKDELVDAISSISSKLLVDYQSIPSELSRDLEIEGNVKNTKVSVCDTLSYLIGWGKLVLKWYQLKSNGKPVDFPETGYKWNQLGELAQSFQIYYKDWDFVDLQFEFKSTTKEILDLINTLDNYALYETLWYEQWTLGRMVQFNTSSPMKNMRTKVRRFKKAHGIN
ncbi:ClbS/DfsB family four-helix bundle protein [Aliivibrio fischeri]|uniref:ClbS/DfsB family four-helix bundle protein n=1 Tax=Aliivibrio fischeri TaxID=668 RepID=UPI001F238074|nr:ClbS/DfsB family four-helix bundle protein [Aliivibrio fischeri]MCE7556421.1 ClbS/DfsB family four-helix bundle protein [Aliivibrio fischeri]MCE7563014.1 ClbS/DfsB family four-helix bundle protein [Aliivibrio fischeri]MCE7571306.1 ClbS/DfsB family four-helix bundle protein [Aliivibrio fischeri]